MKTFSVAVAVAVMLTFICIQESSPSTSFQDSDNDNPAVEHQETSVDSWMMPYNRQKRGIKCRFCCGCCTPSVCGLCCRS
uniref:Hepcidin-like n=1 Tax=Seriola dumerili TaxID=41447 RepID=A0A3B4U8E9_SERDU